MFMFDSIIHFKGSKVSFAFGKHHTSENSANSIPALEINLYFTYVNAYLIYPIRICPCKYSVHSNSVCET